MSKNTKEITETIEVGDNLLVKTISSSYTRKINPQNYSSKYGYESLEVSETAWADLETPVPVNEVTPYLDELHLHVKDHVSGSCGAMVAQLVARGKANAFDPAAVYQAFIEYIANGETNMDVDNAWSEFRNIIAVHMQKDFR